MKARFLASFAVAAGCSQTPAPVCPTPTTASVATAEAESDVERGDGSDAELEASATMSADGLYACARPRGDVEVTLREGFTAKDLVVSYIGVTCANVLLPVELADRSHKAGFHGRLKPAEIAPRFRALFEELGLGLVRARGAAIVVDQAWLAPRPGLLLFARADSGALVAPHSSTTPPPPPDEPVDVDFAITKISDTHHRITRAGVSAAIAGGTRGARIMASVKNGQPNGVKLYAVRSSSVYARLGIANGDTVHSINGVDVKVAGELAPDQLLSEPRLELAITRRGKPLVLVIEIRD